jgi:hypothetical protein
MRFSLGILGALLATAAIAQPVQLPPATTAPVGELLASAPDIAIGNGLIAAHVARIDAARGFYNGTRFDQAGVITSLTLNGREFYGPWFEKTARNGVPSFYKTVNLSSRLLHKLQDALIHIS